MPRTKDQNEKITAKRKECILHSALTLFAIYGYHAINIEEIGKYSKCSRTLIYHYFDSKEAIFHELMKKMVHKITEITDSIDYDQKAKYSLYELIDKLLHKMNHGKEQKYMTYVIYLLLNLPLQEEYIPKPKCKDCCKERTLGQKRLFEIIHILIERGQKENEFYQGDPKEYTIAVLSLIKGLAYNRIYMKKNYTPVSAKTVLNLVMKKEEIL